MNKYLSSEYKMKKSTWQDAITIFGTSIKILNINMTKSWRQKDDVAVDGYPSISLFKNNEIYTALFLHLSEPLNH